MKHLIICREYPPAPYPAGGIGTYVLHIARLLAESGETVHVIGQLSERAQKEVEEECQGRLIIHRIPLDDWTALWGTKPNPALQSREALGLFHSNFYPQCFSWEACMLAEKLIVEEGIDVIEGQDYEAPLYYLQLRRALGLGPKRLPPLFVHLHSPTEILARHNDGCISNPYFLFSKRFEDYSIAGADALLCPSRYLSQQLMAHYGLEEDRIHRIPYPIGDSLPFLDRDLATWERGTVYYMGRLERRKGVIEWIEAAVTVANKYPNAQFEFVGANVLGNSKLSGEEFVDSLIPENIRTRFYFRGEQKHSDLPQFLAGARLAAVPSRWENFPNTCIEAMCSGLPVIATMQGGMADMLNDGRTGWLAERAERECLAEALRRALETPPAQLAEMGRKASFDIRKMCDNKKIWKCN